MFAKQFFKATVGTFGTEIGIHLLGFITTIIITRNIPPADFGIFSLILSFSFTLCYISSVGFPEAIVFFIGKRKQSLDSIFAFAFFLFLCIGVVVTIVCFVFKDYPLNSFLRELPRRYFFPLLLLYFFSLYDGFLLSIVRGVQNYLLFNIRRLITAMGNLLGICLVFLFFGLSLQSIVTVFISISFVSTVWFFIKVISITSFRLHFNWTSMKSFFTYGIKSYSQILTGHLIYQVDIYIISYFLGVKHVAFYSIAVAVATLLWYIPNTIGTVLFPSLASMQKEEDIHLFSAMVCRNALFITAFGAIVLGLVGKYIIIFFYGEAYIQSVNAMWLILPGIVAMSAYKILTRNFSSRNRQQVSIIVAIISLIVNVCLNFLWIPRYGIEGASLASTVAYFLAGATLVLVVKKESKIPLRNILLIEKNDIKHFISLVNRFVKKSNP